MWRGENLEYDMGGWKEEREVDESCGVRVMLVGGRGHSAKLLPTHIVL